MVEGSCTFGVNSVSSAPPSQHSQALLASLLPPLPSPLPDAKHRQQDGRPSGEATRRSCDADAKGWGQDARRAVREKDRHHMGDRYVELFLLNEGGG
eukprot:3459762-Rhodomonas_salina.1